MAKLPHIVHTRRVHLQLCQRSVGLCSSGSIMAYPDDKSMTKMGRNVHVPVMQTGYTLAMAIVLEVEIHYPTRSQARRDVKETLVPLIGNDMRMQNFNLV